ncbi:Uncharacterised protein [Legionella busanensis]|uniref:Uncharacterized protein n=1 Tax=Legionella busanensis TaxID=190655 RepID=A0A378KHF9_9GAMM|nr:hypothetical protein [Legionella busanensis]STX81224.1 Uncharacterised protein [Legionella busanensis]
MFTKKEKIYEHVRSHCTELSAVNSKLEALRERKNKIELTAQANGLMSKDYKKFYLLDNFIKKIDSLMEKFNNTMPNKLKDKELVEIKGLLLNIWNEIGSLHVNQFITLFTPRNNQRQNVNNFFHRSTTLLSATAGTILFGPLAGVGFYFGGHIFSNLTQYITGLSSTTPKSAIDMLELIAEVTTSITGIDRSLNVKEQFLGKSTFSNLEWIDAEKVVKPDTIYLLHNRQLDILECITLIKDREYRLNLTDYLNDEEKKILNLRNLPSQMPTGMPQILAILVAFVRFGYSNCLNPTSDIEINFTLNLK